MHRTTTRFWKCFANLPEPVQDVSLRIRPFISRKSVSFGQFESGLIAERLR